MDAFTTLSGAAAPLMRANIDTDVIIRIERLTGTSPQETGPYAFEALKLRQDGSLDPGFVLNQEPFRDAPILIVGENFGCGSSREGAVWALRFSGIRCVIGPSFGDIFFNNCFQNGLLPVILPKDEVERLAEACRGGNARVTIDLEAQVVIGPHGETMPFRIDTIRREALLKGLDEIGLTLQHEDAITAFRTRDWVERPWVWGPGRENGHSRPSPRDEAVNGARRAP